MTRDEIAALMSYKGEVAMPDEQRQFIIYIPHLVFHGETLYTESAARLAAEEVARANRGTTVCIAKIIGSVSEPLPKLEWGEGAPPPREAQRLGIRSLGEKADTPNGGQNHA
jgi:hypothetical protein